MTPELPILGYVVVPATVLMLMLAAPRGWWIAWIVFWAPFQGASVLDVGIGDEVRSIQPGVFALAGFVARLTLDMLHRGAIRYNGGVIWVYAPLLVFAAAAVASAVLVPALLGGEVEVLMHRRGLAGAMHGAVPLTYSPGNVTQSLYIAFFVFVALLFSHMDTSPPTIRVFVASYLASGAAVLAVGFWQFAAWRFGWHYPAEVFNSSVNLQHGLTQTMAGLKRWSGPFLEPSMAAFWLSGFFVFTSSYYFYVSRRAIVLTLSLMSFVALVLSTSATAAAALAIVFAVGTWCAFKRLIAGQVAVRQVAWGLLLSIMALAAGVALVFSSMINEAVAVFDAGIVQKEASASFKSRSTADLHSLRLIVETWGLGAGWGSNRPSSMMMAILSNVGLWGALLLGLFAVRLRRLYRAARGIAPLADHQRMRCLLFSLLAMLLAGVIAVPDIAWPSLWLHLGVLSALAVRYARHSASRWSHLFSSVQRQQIVTTLRTI